jgi:predicted ATPase/DNA-binding SARP family transcriptional activator
MSVQQVRESYHLIGREAEILAIKRYISTVRLLTITGAGGSGKTCLASQVVAEMIRKAREKVQWLDLAQVSDPFLLPQALTSLLGIHEQPGRPHIDLLVSYLYPRKLLLVLDNCEHLVEASAHLIGPLLHFCPRLHILVTSRETLRIPGEKVWPVPPLSLPDLTHLPPPEECMYYEAIQLFVEQAMAARPSFKLTHRNAEVIAQICWRLEGIPLAIELVSARTRGLSVGQIKAQLDDDSWLLDVGDRRMQPKHQSIRLMIDASHTLLTEKERLLLYRLSIFHGRFLLQGVESVCIGGILVREELLDLLTGLVNKSLVIAEDEDDEMHYRLLAMIRQYSREKLRERGEQAIIDERYQRWCLSTLSILTSRHEPEEPPTLSIVRTTQAWNQAPLPPPELRILALGSTSVYKCNQALMNSDWKYAKARELFFYLLVHKGKTKEQIGLSLWPDLSSDQLRSMFHSVLYCLRKALGAGEWICFENNVYFFNGQLHYWFDVEAFENSLAYAQQLLPEIPAQAIQKLQEAAELYRGNLFRDQFEGDWYIPQRERLRKKYEEVLLTLGKLFFAEKRYTEAAHVYSRLISFNSFLEIAHRELMRCYERLGERGQVLLHYQTLTRMMQDELGTVPAPETRQLITQLCRDEDI